MFIIRMILRVLWKIWFTLSFCISLIILFPFFFILLLNERTFKYAFVLEKIWGRYLLLAGGIFWTIEYKEELSYKTPYIFVSNHASYLDIILMFCVSREYIVFIAKSELTRAPLFSIFFKQMHIPVNRKSNRDSHKAFIRIAEELDKGHNVVIFPEGTIPNTAPYLKNFKNGAFKLAIEKQMPIVPITFVDNWKLLQPGAFLKSNGRPGISHTIVHAAISTKGMGEADIETLRQKVFNIIKEPLYNETDR
jgi:1-acyl-sn-glycerol-3-phosphate acyltransferase